MFHEDIEREYSEFPRESVPEVLRFAAELADRRESSAFASCGDEMLTGAGQALRTFRM